MSITAEQAAELVAKAIGDVTKPIVEKLDEIATRAPTPAAEATPPAPAAPQLLTRSQLDAAVREGKITDAEAVALWDQQQARETERLVNERVQAALQQHSAESTVEQQIAEYARLKPDVLKKDARERERVHAQYEHLVRTGLPKSKATELAALQIIYGPLDALKAASTARGTDETHQEGFSGQGGAGDGGADSMPKGLKLSAAQQKFYQDAIGKGLYKDWAAVQAELKFADKRLMARHGSQLH